MQRLLPEETPFNGMPYVGCAVTIPVGSDSYPATVTWVSDETVQDLVHRVPRRILIQRCDYRGVKGHANSFTEDQRYVYFEKDGPPLNQEMYSFRLRYGYVRVGDRSGRGCQPLVLGRRRYYYDPCF